MSTSTDLTEIRKALRQFNDFRECVIQEIVWKEQHFGLDVALSYIWTDDGRICYSVGAAPRVAYLSFSIVQELHFRNNLRDVMVSNADKLNWGTSEIAKLEVDSDSEHLVAYRNSAIPFFHGRFIWEWGRMIDLVFARLSVEIKQL